MKIASFLWVLFLTVALSEPVHSKQGSLWNNRSESITAQFDHGGYRTIISDTSPFILAQLDEKKGLFVLGGTSESGVVSWSIGDQIPQAIGPLVIAIASDSVSEEEFNQWIADWEDAEVDPTLFIPVSAVTPELVVEGSENKKLWSNDYDVTARLFIRSCGDGVFQNFGELKFFKQGIKFWTWMDDQGDPQVEFNADLVQLLLDENTWKSLLEDCDLKGLPTTPTVGTSVGFWATSVREPHVQGTYPNLVEGVVDQLRSLVFQEVLGAKDAGNLRDYLNKASQAALKAGEAEKVSKNVSRFRNSVSQLTEQGILDESQADSLNAGVNEIESFVDILHTKLTAFPNPDNYCPDPEAPCPIREPCDSTIFFVRSYLDILDPDGTINNPFPTIVEALEQAGKQMLCGVVINVGSGVYSGDLVITRDTRIIGPVAMPPTVAISGSIVNNGAFTIQVENATIAANGDGILSVHPCARTILSNVQIIGATGFGVHHRGGVLFANDTTVAATMSLPGILSAGTGILMTCGARGVFHEMALPNNETSGLILVGSGTGVIALDLSVTGTQVHPGFANPAVGDPWGAIHVRDEADLAVYGFSIRNNLAFGLRVETGGQAALTGSTVFREGTALICPNDFRDPRDPTGKTRCAPLETLVPGTHDRVEYINGAVSGTRAVAFSPDGTPRNGSNVAVGGGAIRLTNFVSSRAEHRGVLVERDGEMDLNSGEVTDCLVGAGVLVPGYDISRLTNNVDYLRNRQMLETTGDTLALPDVGVP